MKTTEIPIGRLLPAAWNANRVPARTLTKIRNSIERFGVVENLVARPHPLEEGKFEVISGNHRLQILAEMGFQKVPVVLVDVDDAHARLLAQTLNRTRGEDDPQAYAALLEHALAQVGQQTALTYLNETESSLNRFLNQVRSRQLGDVDDAPEPPAKADSKPGTVYEIGPHRVACGDATDPAIWKQLLDGEQGHLVLTDPPYGVDYGEKTRQMASRSTVRARSDLAGDAHDPIALRSLLVGALGAARGHVTAGGGFYVFHSDLNVETFRGALRDAGWRIHQTLIWVKDQLVLGRLDYHAAHELILYGWNPGSAHRWYGTRKESTVLDSQGRSGLKKEQLREVLDEQQRSIAGDVILEHRPRKSKLHPTMKPVALLEYLLLNSSQRGDIVLDPFGGSGSTVIACEKRGRRCFAIELDPAYCDVIRRRYETTILEPVAV